MLRKQKHAAMSILIFNIVPLGITIFSADLLLIIPGVSDKFQPAAHKITALLRTVYIHPPRRRGYERYPYDDLQMYAPVRMAEIDRHELLRFSLVLWSFPPNNNHVLFHAKPLCIIHFQNFVEDPENGRKAGCTTIIDYMLFIK